MEANHHLRISRQTKAERWLMPHIRPGCGMDMKEIDETSVYAYVDYEPKDNEYLKDIKVVRPTRKSKNR